MKLAKYAVIIPLISIVPIILLSGTAKGDVRTEIRLPSQYRDYESSRQHVFRKVTSYLSSIQNGSTKGVDTSRPLSSDDLEYAIDTIGKLTRHYDITDTEAPVFLRALKFLKTTLQDDYPEKLFLILYASLIEDRIHWFVENTDKRKSNFDWIVNNYKDAISEYEINKSEYTNLDAGIAIQMPILPLLLSIEALNFVNDKEKKAELFSGNIISNRQLFPRMPPQMFFSLSQAIVDTTSSNLDELLLRSWLVILDDLVGTSNPGFSHNVYTLAKIYARLGLIKIVQSRNAPREAAEIFQNIIDDYLPRVNNVTAGGPAAVRLFFGGDTTANLYVTVGNLATLTPTDICRDWMGVFRRDELPYVSANRISVSFYVQILITRSRLEALCDGNFDAVSRLELLDEAQALAAYTAPVYRLRHVALLIAFRQASAVGEAARASSYADQMAEIIDDEDVRQSDAGEILVPVVFSHAHAGRIEDVRRFSKYMLLSQQIDYRRTTERAGSIETLEIANQYRLSSYHYITLQQKFFPNDEEIARIAFRATVLRRGATAATLARQRQGYLSASQRRKLALEMDSIGKIIYQHIAETRKIPLGEVLSALLKTNNDDLAIRLKTEQRDKLSMLFKVEDEISQALPDKSALLQYTVYRTADPLDGSGKIVSDPRYVVFYIERGQPIVVSDLGPARPINEKIQLFLRSIKKNSEPEIRRLGIELYNLLLRPVAHRFSDLEQIFISPDWEISSVPFYSLVSDGRYLLNTKLLISHVHSGRDILDWQIDPGAEKRVDLTGEKSVILIGDVNYNAPYDTHSDEGSIVTDELVRLLESSSLSTDPRLRFYPLAGSREEIKQISAVLPNVLVLRGSQASEDRVRSLRGASIIHFATHGYAFSKIDPVLAEMLMHKHRFTDEDFEILLADFHSGISLAGANVRQFKGGDGLLSAAEIAYLDWRDTELVVMSACETGTGVRSSGEGVFGIANALRIAGVKSSLLTLWPVADLSTADFMGAFYAELKKGTSRARAAKFAAISVQQTSYDSPYFWAPFVLYGEASPIWLQ